MSTLEWIRAVIGFSIFALGVPATLFLGAGTLDWDAGWWYALLYVLGVLGSRMIVFVRSPDLLKERAQFACAEDIDSLDRCLVPIVGLVGPLIFVLTAGLDHRFGWSPELPNWSRVLAGLLAAAGYGMAVWAMAVNPFFSAVVRVQRDRGQVVVTQGPYRYVRHPAYAGSVLSSLTAPVMLGAVWALIPAVLMDLAIVVRTRREDQVLLQELDGYVGYAERTPYRLVPGVW